MEKRSLKIVFLVALLAISFGFPLVQGCTRNTDCAGLTYNCSGECINYYCAGNSCYCTCVSGNKVSIVAMQDEETAPTKRSVDSNKKP